MSWKTLTRAWNDFFFRPESPIPISVFRILISVVVLLDAALLRPDWLTWFGPRGMVTMAGSQQVETGPRLNLFAFLPQTEFWSNAIFYALVISAALLCVGLFTRASSIAVFILIASVHQRNLFITNSGDTLLRCTLFFLMFAPAGAALSIDRLRNIWSGREGPEIRPRAPWAQRMIQIQLSLLYFMTFWNKSLGPAWVDGSALWYVNHLDEFRRFPTPGFLHEMMLVKLQTWLTLAVEFALGVLVWIKELRYPILIVGVLLHLSLEYSLNVPMFQWTTLAVYATFVDASVFERAWRRLASFGPLQSRRPILVSYRPDVLDSRRAAAVLQALDIFGCLKLVTRKDREAGAAFPLNGLSSLTRIAPRLWAISGRSRSVAITANSAS
jgi:hypothetical protein